MRRLVPIFLMLILLLGGNGVGQNDPIFRVRSELIPVYVSVTDKRGRPVQGLSASDFYVYEEGVEQSIEVFDEISWGKLRLKSKTADPARAPGSDDKQAIPQVAEAAESARTRARENRFIVIRFDSQMGNRYSKGRFGIEYDAGAGPAAGFRRTHLAARDVRRAQEAARSFVELMDPESDFAAVSFQNLISEFTRDRERLLELIDMISPGKTEQMGTGLNVDEVVWAEDRVGFGPVTVEGDRSGGAILSPNDSFSGVFDPTPTQDAFLSETRQLLLSSHLDAADLVSRLKELQGRKVLLFFGEGLPEVSREDKNLRRFDPRFNARIYNDAGFTVYAISPSGVTVSGPSNPIVRSSIRSMSPRARSAAVFHIPSSKGLDNIYLRRWTETTGGTAYYNRNDLKKGVREALESLSHAYLLAYRSTNPTPDNMYRRIRVDLTTDSKVEVRHRGGYFATMPRGDQVRERTLATAMLSPSRFQEFPLETSAEIGASPSNIRFFVSFPFENIRLHQTLVPGEKKDEMVPRYFQEIRVFVAAFSKSGAYLGSYEQPFFLDLADEQLDSLRQQNATLERVLTTTSGEIPAALKTVVVVGQNEQVSVHVLELGR